MENTRTLHEIIPFVMNSLRAYQYSDNYTNSIRRHFYRVVDYYSSAGITHYKPGIYDSFLLHIENEYVSGNLQQGLFWLYRKCAFYIDEYCRLGSVTPRMLVINTGRILNKEFDEALENYLSSLKTTIKDSTIYQRRIAIRKYLLHFQSIGCKTLDDITVVDVRQYFIKLSSIISNRTLNQNRLHIRQFHVYLYEIRKFAPSWLAFLDFKIVVPKKIQGYLTAEEIESILSQINVNTNIGKRDYAIICLAKATGLRGIDIINLKLTDINWEIGVITICQKKTGVTLKLPLIKETGNALKDYILNARPATDCKEIFTRINAPYTALRTTSSLEALLKKYQKKAGIIKMPRDGKAFHGTRRGFGRNLVLAKVPVTNIIQVLGQSQLDSAKPYMMLNTPELKECALDFTDIPLKRGELI